MFIIKYAAVGIKSEDIVSEEEISLDRDLGVKTLGKYLGVWGISTMPLYGHLKGSDLKKWLEWYFTITLTLQSNK